jgi:hypothetical protein
VQNILQGVANYEKHVKFFVSGKIVWNCTDVKFCSEFYEWKKLESTLDLTVTIFGPKELEIPIFTLDLTILSK